jgi:hypothetical protein
MTDTQTTTEKKERNRAPQKAITLTMPLGLYHRLEELAAKARMNLHAYCVHVLWRESDWKSMPKDGNENKE